MTLCQRRIYAGSILGACIALGVGWLVRLDYGQKISTDVLDLIPGGERDPQLALVRELASEAEARTMLLVLTGADGRPVPSEVAQRFALELGRSPAFRQAIALGHPGWRDALGRELFELRFTLLFPLWLREREEAFRAGSFESFPAWLADTAAAELQRFLETPPAIALQDLVPADPLLLVPRAMEQLQHGLAAVGAEASGPAAAGLVWAQIAASPLTAAGQEPVFAAIAQALATVRESGVSLNVEYTGINRFAHVSRARIQREVAWLNVGSVLAVVAVAALFIRQVRRGLHLLPVVALSLLAGWVATTAVFERVHIVVLVIGALLAGVAIDYGFHIFAHPALVPGEAYADKLRRLMKPLVVSCFTTAVGFALLLLAELPLIRQVGCFVIAGLIGAAAGAVLYFSTLENPFLEIRPTLAPRLRSPRVRRAAIYGFAVLALLALPGLARITWRDDIRELEVPAVELQREDARIRAAFGDRGGGSAWLTRGRTLDEARAALRTLETQVLRERSYANLGAVVPTSAELARARRFLRENTEFAPQVRAALARHGFDAAEFAPFFAALSAFAAEGGETELAPAIARLQAKLVGPAGLLLHTGRDLNWFVTIVSDGAPLTPPDQSHTIPVSQLQSLNELFGRYRQTVFWLCLAGLGIVGVGVALVYGVRDGLRIFAIPAGACLGVFGFWGWIGEPLNMFHLLGALLGVCLTHDYAIFAAASAYRGEPPPVSVRLSGLTTAASFGVLATSAIPAVRALGATVALLVLAALLVIEFEPLRTLGRKA